MTSSISSNYCNWNFKNVLVPQENPAEFTETSPRVNTQLQKYTTTILIYICIAAICIWFGKYVWRRRYIYYHSWNIPGPTCLPFIGYGIQFIMSNSIVECLTNLQKKYPDVCAAWFGPKLYYLIEKPEYVEKILTNQNALNKEYLYKFIIMAIGEGLLTSKATKWKKHRKAIMPAFNQKILDYFQEIFAEKAEVLTSLIQKELGNKELNLAKYLSNCTLDIICKTALDLEMNSQESNNDFGENLDRLMDIITTRIFNICHHLTFTWPLYPISREYEKCKQKFLSFNQEVVDRKLQEYEKIAKNRRDSDAQLEEGLYKLKNGKIAFLDLIIENTNFTRKEIQEEVNIFIIAGTDTTTSTLCCLFTMLGMFPDVQQKVLDEILDIMGPDRRVLPSDLPLMKYTERVIKETLRLFPVAVFFLREIKEDVNGGDMIFPAGSSAFIGALVIHRNPKYWPDPLKFDPDRFLPENVAKRHPCCYVPFSYGPRNCIGARYGIMNMKTILATVLRKFKIFTQYKSVEEIELDCHIILRLKHGPKVWVGERDK